MSLSTEPKKKEIVTPRSQISTPAGHAVMEGYNAEKEVLVSVDNVSKKFCRNLKKSMAYGIMDLIRNLVGIKTNSSSLRMDEFWATRNISFELKRGEILGLIGPNGSGKTTLLRMLAGIFPPDEGQITIRGRVGALIALGAGFHPHMTGRENIFLNGAILGLERFELEEKFENIVEFAEIEDFIDAPVSTYSSGMKVRLGFAIAAQMEPDILLIDEILAVGDVGFRAKCFNAIDHIMKNAAVIYVSHNMAQIYRTCTKIIVMENGKLNYNGDDVPLGIETFYSRFTEVESIIAGSGRARIGRIELERNNHRKGITSINYCDNLKVHIYVEIERAIVHPNIVVSFFNKESQVIAQCNSFFDGCIIKNKGEILHCILDVGKIEFNPGTYSIGITVTAENLGEVLLKHLNAFTFHVSGPFHGFAPIIISSQWFVDQSTNGTGGQRSG